MDGCGPQLLLKELLEKLRGCGGCCFFRDSKIIRGALSCRCSSSLRNFGVEQVLSRTKWKLGWRLLLLLLLLNLIGEQQQNGCSPFVSISGLLRWRWLWLWLWLSLSLLSHSRANAHTIVVTAIAKIPLHRGAFFVVVSLSLSLSLSLFPSP